MYDFQQPFRFFEPESCTTAELVYSFESKKKPATNLIRDNDKNLTIDSIQAIPSEIKILFRPNIVWRQHPLLVSPNNLQKI